MKCSECWANQYCRDKCYCGYEVISFNYKSWYIWMSHWRCRATEGAEFWISCKWPAFLSNSSRLQLIQNSAPSVAWLRQCNIQITCTYSAFKGLFLKKISCYQKSYRHVIYNTVWEFDVVPAVYTVAGGLFWFLSCRACPREKCSENAQLGIFSHLKPFLSFKSYMYT